MKLPHHFTARFGRPTNAVQENGTYGDEGKAVGCVPPTALLFEARALHPSFNACKAKPPAKPQ